MAHRDRARCSAGSPCQLWDRRCLPRCRGLGWRCGAVSVRSFSCPPITSHFPCLNTPRTCMVSGTARSTFLSMGSRTSATGPARLFHSLFTSPLIQQPFSSPGCLARGLDFPERARFFFAYSPAFSTFKARALYPRAGDSDHSPATTERRQKKIAPAPASAPCPRVVLILMPLSRSFLSFLFFFFFRSSKHARRCDTRPPP